jgi:hypothetical protein
MCTDYPGEFYGGFQFPACSTIDSFSTPWNTVTSILNFVIIFLACETRTDFYDV